MLISCEHPTQPRLEDIWQEPEKPPPLPNQWNFFGPYRGSVSSILLDPRDTNTVYVAMTEGLLYKTTNSGQLWNTIQGDFPFRKGLKLIRDPQDPDIIYLTTTEGGLYRSTDGGESWERIPTPHRFITSLVINPLNPQEMVIGASRGIYKSTNGGASWLLITRGLGPPLYVVPYLALNPQNPQQLFLSIPRRGVFRSDNGGLSWKAISRGLPDSLVGSIQVDPKTPTTLYLCTFGKGVYKSLDAGEHWFPSNKGQTYGTIRTLVIDSRYPHFLYAGTFLGRVYRSSDAGRSWEDITRNLSGIDFINDIALQQMGRKRVYIGTSAGVYFLME